MTTSHLQMSKLKDIIVSLEQTIDRTSSKHTAQKQILAEYIRTFQKLSGKLSTLSNKIKQSILNDVDQNDKTICNIFQKIGNNLQKLSQCSKNVFIMTKNQALQPMKLFIQNYQIVNKKLLVKLKQQQKDLLIKYFQLQKNKQLFMASSQKLHKQKKAQTKLLNKSQNGDKNQHDKLANNLKLLTETVKSTQQNYQSSIKKINLNTQQLKKTLQQTLSSLLYNQQSRIAFISKNLLHSMRLLQILTTFYDINIYKQIDQQLKNKQNQKPQDVLNKNLNHKILLLINSQHKQSFNTYADMIKQKKKKFIQEEKSNHYQNQLFTKLRQDDRQLITTIVKSIFQPIQSKKPPSHNQQLPKQRIKTDNNIYLNQWQLKILSNINISCYFIEIVYQKVSNVGSCYCKISDEYFLFFLNVFIKITTNLQTQENISSSTSMIALQYIYKMIQISSKIINTQQQKFLKQTHIQLLSYNYGKQCKYFHNQNNLKKIYYYLQKNKIQKKNINDSPPLTMMNYFVKGMGDMFRSKKQLILSQNDIVSCLTQITHIVANLLIPSEIAIPLIKGLLGKNQNLKVFEHLKSILDEKKNIEERQKLFYLKQIKKKKQDRIQQIIQSKTVAAHCIKIVAKRGYFTKKQFCLKLVCSQLRNIHRQILYRLGMRTQDWIHLIPLNPKLDYIAMKQQVAQQTVPSSIQQIITLDVNRSLHNHGEALNPTILHSLLRIYAHYHKDISYCQGMNYIAGYLYLKTKDEESAYRIFEYLMEVRFKELFANEFQVLKIKMYQFDRLLAIFHPQISSHFKTQGILPQCYIVSWIITLFASSYQYTMDSYLIDVLWERFIIWGWREFFRFVLSYFSSVQEKLIQLVYDKALHQLGETGKSELFLTGKDDFAKKFPENSIESGMQLYPITNELLQNLNKQYKLHLPNSN